MGILVCVCCCSKEQGEHELQNPTSLLANEHGHRYEMYCYTRDVYIAVVYMYDLWIGLPSTSLRTAALWPQPAAWLVRAASPIVCSLIALQQALHLAN